jgi:hypothetical protein
MLVSGNVWQQRTAAWTLCTLLLSHACVRCCCLTVLPLLLLLLLAT